MVKNLHPPAIASMHQTLKLCADILRFSVEQLGKWCPIHEWLIELDSQSGSGC